MQLKISYQTLAKITNGILCQASLKDILKSVSYDTRTLQKGQAYIALKGANFDGHTFIKKALEKAIDDSVKSSKKLAYVYKSKLTSGISSSVSLLHLSSLPSSSSLLQVRIRSAQSTRCWTRHCTTPPDTDWGKV